MPTIFTLAPDLSFKMDRRWHSQKYDCFQSKAGGTLGGPTVASHPGKEQKCSLLLYATEPGDKHWQYGHLA